MNRTRSRNTLQGGAQTDMVYVLVHNPHQSNSIKINNTGALWASGDTLLTYSMAGTGQTSGWDGVVETISDEATPGFSKENLEFNDCEHTKLLYSKSISSSSEKKSYPGYLGGVQVCDVDVTVYYDLYADARLKAFPPVFAGWDYAALKMQAINNMRFEPPSKLDLPLFVAELRDFGRTFDSVRKTLVNGKALATREMSRAGVVGGTWAADFGLKAFGSMTFKQIKSLAHSPRAVVHELVGLDLYWKFALKPFLDGCLTMSNMMRDLEEMRNSLANPKPFRVRGTAKSLTTSPSTGTDTGVYRYDRVIERSDEAHAWALVRRRPYEASHWDAFKKVYAIRPRPSLAYSVATLSFVFDWFVNVGRFLRQFERPMVKDLDLEILDTAWSVKRTEVYSDKLHFTVTSGAAGCPVPSGELVGVASTTGTQYLRSTSELLLDSSYIEPVQIGFPDAGKVWSGVELILSAMTR